MNRMKAWLLPAVVMVAAFALAAPGAVAQAATSAGTLRQSQSIGLRVMTAPITPVATSGPTLKLGSHGPEVVQLQKRLTYLHYMPGKADGNFGSMTQQAVVTLQKLYGMSRDGVVGPKTWRVIAAARPVGMPAWGRGLRAAVDINRQVMLYYHGRSVSAIGISSGSELTFRNPRTGAVEVAHTPRGTFRIIRRVIGLDRSPLGVLYDPGYFTGGYAIHGSPSVPPWPASHGCIRVPMSLRLDVMAAMPVGASVIIR